MKKLLFILLFGLFTVTNLNAQVANKNGTSWEKLIYAIEEHESKHIETVKSSNGKYWGVLQISQVLVRECNNIVGYNKYTYNDRLNRYKSYEMFRTTFKKPTK